MLTGTRMDGGVLRIKTEATPKTGFEKFTASVKSFFNKREIAGAKSEVQNAIAREYGKDIASKVMTKIGDAPLTVGSMSQMKVEAESLRQEKEDKARNQPEKNSFQTVIGDMNKMNNEYVRLSEGTPDNHATKILGEMFTKYKDTSDWDTFSKMSSAILGRENFMKTSDQPSSVDPLKSNAKVIDENLQKNDLWRDKGRQLGVADFGILAVQIGPRFNMFANQLTEGLDKVHDLKGQLDELTKKGKKAGDEDFDAISKKIVKAESDVSHAADEVETVMTRAGSDYEMIGKLFQDPQTHAGLTEDAASALKDLGRQYAELGEAFKKDGGLTQNFIATAKLAATDPDQAYANMHA